MPAVHWRLIGWWRGEAFYRGRPTSYHRLFGRASRCHLGWAVEFPEPKFASWVRQHVSSDLADWLHDSQPPMSAPGADAVPVLLQMLGDPDQSVRIVAVGWLHIVRPPARDALPALRAMLDGSDGQDADLRFLVETVVRDIETGTYR
jgi:hypothetical protein